MASPEFLIAILDSSVVIQVSGKDSERYLNNRISNNIKILKAEEAGTYAAALSVQGKTEAFFFIQRLAAENYLLHVDAGDSQSIIKSISRYKVADRVNFEDVSRQKRIFHIFSPSANAEITEQILIQNKFFSENTKLLNRRNRFGTSGLDIMFSSANLESEENSVKHEQLAFGFINHRFIDNKEQLLIRLKARIPSFPIELGPDYLLQESNLTGSYSTSKGCYVGQEVIQKIASFANTPAKLVSFNCMGQIDNSSFATTEPDGNEKIGELLSHAYDSVTNTTYGFMRVKSKAIREIHDIRGFIVNNMIKFYPIVDFTLS